MSVFDFAKTVFVFDLDDTLYPESDYVSSGMAHVCDVLFKSLGLNLREPLDEAMAAGETDWLGFLTRQAGLPASAKESLLWAYRLHFPNIALSKGCSALLRGLENRGAPLIVVTDGRSITQRLKLKALKLAHLPALISEDWGGADKRDPARFVEIMSRFPEKAYLYVADNPQKDFIAPRALGWSTVGVKGGSGRIHPTQYKDLTADEAPDLWLGQVEDLSMCIGRMG